MATTIKLYYTDRNSTYKEWELIPSKLLIVEDIVSYLATKSALTFSNIQYIKNELEIGVNLDLSQSYSQPKTATSFKYVSIQNENEMIHYYFVKKIVWRSKSAVRLELVMDVLNTFQEGQDYEFKENTRIIREHKDRFDDVITSIEITTENLTQEGMLNEGDEVRFFFQVGGVEYTICTGKFVSAIGDTITISVDKGYHTHSVNQKITASPLSSVNKYIMKDNSNGYQFGIFVYLINGGIYRKIDNVSEGINPVLIRSKEERKIEKSSILNQDWYLLYRNQNDPSESQVNPVDCYLIPENTTPTDSGVVENGRVVPSWFESGKVYVFNMGIGKGLTLSNGYTFTSNSDTRYYLIAQKCGTKIALYLLDINSPERIKCSYGNIEYITFSSLPIAYAILNVLTDKKLEDIPYIDFDERLINTEEYTDVDSITLLDKTDAKNIKLIKLPYVPYNFSIEGDVLNIDSSTDWEIVALTQAGGGVIHALHLIDLHTKLEDDISSSYNPFSKLFFDEDLYGASLTDLRAPISDEYESKLFHSDFYSPSFVYDSFSMKIDLEKCDLESYIDNYSTNSIKFTMTRTINSKFLFTFTSYVCDKAEQNFYNVMPIARNNEEVLYNVPYINYIRTGFNYDVKAKNTQNISNYVGLGLSGASIGASLLMPSVPLKIAGIIGSLVSMAMSIKSTIVSTINNDNSIKQKQEQYKNQATSVAGSDDVDLMSEYCENRLRYYVYTPTPVMRALLNDLFFYAGYSSNRMGLPNHNTRVNFDYLECEASIQAIASIPDECLTELVNCFKNGCTYLHKTSRNTNKWDFKQQYENWEKWVLE